MVDRHAKALLEEKLWARDGVAKGGIPARPSQAAVLDVLERVVGHQVMRDAVEDGPDDLLDQAASLEGVRINERPDQGILGVGLAVGRAPAF